MRIQATSPFLIAGVHHPATDEDGAPAVYGLPDDIGAQVVVSGRAIKLPDPKPE